MVSEHYVLEAPCTHDRNQWEDTTNLKYLFCYLLTVFHVGETVHPLSSWHWDVCWTRPWKRHLEHRTPHRIRISCVLPCLRDIVCSNQTKRYGCFLDICPRTHYPYITGIYDMYIYIYIFRAKRVSNWYTPQKKSARLPACTCQIILVLVFTYVNTTYVSTSARYRICIYVCAFRPCTSTSDDSYIYQLSLVLATAIVSFDTCTRADAQIFFVGCIN